MFSSARLTAIISVFRALLGDVAAETAEAAVFDLDEFESVGRFHFHELLARSEAVGGLAAAVARIGLLGGGGLRGRGCGLRRIKMEVTRGRCGGLTRREQLTHRIGFFDTAERGVDHVQVGQQVRGRGELDEGPGVVHPHPEVVLELARQLSNELLEDVMGIEPVTLSRVSEANLVGMHCSGEFVDFVCVGTV